MKNRRLVSFLSLFSLVLVELAKVNKLNDDIDELNLIVASSSSTMEEKVEALEMIARKKKLNKEEIVLKQAIKEAGYSNAYVEYEDNLVNILVSKKFLIYDIL